MKKVDVLDILLNISRTITATLDIEKVVAQLLSLSVRVMGSDHAALFLLDERSKHLLLTDVKGFSLNEIENIGLLSGWEKVNRRVLKERHPIIVNDVERSAYFSDKDLPLTSFLSVPLKVKAKIVGIIIVSNARKGIHFKKEDEDLLSTLANQAAIALLNARLYGRLKAMLISTVRSLAEAIDAKDPYTHGHSERVTNYSLEIAKKLGLSEKDRANLRLSGLLHDVGKIGINDRILTKKGRLSSGEFDQMKQHPSIGVRIVGNIEHAEGLIPGIRDHHERYDGKGYPQGLKKEEISIEGRIIAVADSFDAMCSNRPYRLSMSKEKAIMEIKRLKGLQFCPRVVEAFLKRFA